MATSSGKSCLAAESTMAFCVQGSFQLVMDNYRGYSQASEVEGDGKPELFLKGTDL